MGIVLIFLLGFCLTAIGLPPVIKRLRASKEQAVIRVLGPDHQKKAGTPSLGGAVFVTVAIVLAFALPTTYASQHSLWTTIVLAVGLGSFALIGAVDDVLKMRLHADDGFAFKPKLLAQTVAALAVMVFLQLLDLPNTLPLPFLGTVNLGLFFICFLWFWLVGWSNATNLTDGLDGLLTGLAVIAYLADTVLAQRQDNPALVHFNIILIGTLLAFLCFNKPKAKIFMGDTGSLALGAGLAVESILLQSVWSLLVLGLVFVIETLSVIIQTISYHYFHKRVFPMAPIHHSFEKYAWTEWQIDVLFWVLGLGLAWVTLACF
ncbi:phospho-N-acetylmuramoyl-pentapeptide-transferase [Leuconostocaceae bacterium ESL0958]|nr:phospho-N-acetylmuramoyl-pentapeptide-transferase [Leuconostocaceae bacterium ESL0958]